jgi:hypothetical protein
MDKLSNTRKLFIIGAPKAGTTSLHYYISQHPNILMSKYKETQFFIRDELYLEGLDFFYNKYFSFEKEKIEYIGESTPAYLANFKVVSERLSESFSHTSLFFIVILRNPVARAWSNYQHNRSNFSEHQTFEEALAQEFSGGRSNRPIFFQYYAAGLYHSQLQEWIQYFGRDKFLILFYEELSDTNKLFDKIFTFLNLRTDVSIDSKTTLNVASTPRWGGIYKVLRRLRVGALARSVIPKHLRHEYRIFARNVLQKPVKERNEIPVEIKNRLTEMYRPEIENLEDLTEVHLESWRN